MAEMPERIWLRIKPLVTGGQVWDARPEPRPEATDYIRADLVDDLVKALERSEAYILDAVNEHVEKIKTLAGYDRLIARQEAYKRDVEEDLAMVRAALTRIKREKGT